MDKRHFQGTLSSPNGQRAELSLTIFVTTSRGLKTGSGTFDVPPALVGSVTDGMLTYETDEGEIIKLLVTRHEITQGRATFKTSGPVPEVRRIA